MCSKFSRVAECRSEVGSARFLWMLAVCLDGCHVTRNGPLMARIFPISCDFSWSSGGQDLARPKSRRVHGPSERRFFRRLYRRQATTLTSPREFKKFLTVNFALLEHIWPEPRATHAPPKTEFFIPPRMKPDPFTIFLDYASTL